MIAIEEHYRSPEVSAAVGGAPRPPDVEARLADLGERRLADMDAAGIDLQVLSHVGGAEMLEPAVAIPLVRAENDRLARVVAGRPDRFQAFALLPVGDPEAAADELARTVGELGFRGAMVSGRPAGRFMDDPVFDPLWARAEALGVPIYLHPAPPPGAVVEAYYAGFRPEVSRSLATFAWGWHIETAIHVLRLIAGGVFDRFPRVQVVVGHMGEALPFMLDRAAERLSPSVTGLERELPGYFRENVHVTTSGFFTEALLRCAVDVLGADRVMFSVDYPFSDNREGRDFLDQAPLSDADRERIAHGNAERLLGLAAE